LRHINCYSIEQIFLKVIAAQQQPYQVELLFYL